MARSTFHTGTRSGVKAIWRISSSRAKPNQRLRNLDARRRKTFWTPKAEAAAVSLTRRAASGASWKGMVWIAPPALPDG